MATPRPIRLPRQWPEYVKSGILHAISLASVVLTFARGRAIGRRRLRVELEQAQSEIALLQEELHITDISHLTLAQFHQRVQRVPACFTHQVLPILHVEEPNLPNSKGSKP